MPNYHTQIAAETKPKGWDISNDFLSPCDQTVICVDSTAGLEAKLADVTGDSADLRIVSMQPMRKPIPYRPILTLGAGGMGEVTLAVKEGSSDVRKLVVLKTLRRDMLGDESIRRMFLEEACLSARLSHPNVVQVHKVISDGNPILVMEYLDGKPLSAILHQAKDECSIVMQLKILSHVLTGLHYSHELRDYDGTPLHIVHRDISPQNVFVTYEGFVKVLDFGLAKVATKRSRTKSGTIKGKLEYMPVEQMMGGEVDRRVDIYAVGCLLWHACAGARLWADESENSIVRNLVTGNIPRPSTRRPVDPRLEAIAMKALAFDPKNRYQTALEFQQAIDELLQQLPDVPSTHEISKFVTNLFADERQAIAEVIRRAMATPNLRSPTLYDIEEQNRATRSNIRPRPALRPLATAGLVSALVVAGAVGTLQLVPAHESSAKYARAAELPELVTLRISATPLDAVLTLDNRPTHENPVTLVLPKDDRQHELRAVLTGYETISRLIQLERDVSLDLVLQRSPTTSEHQSMTAPSSASSAASTGNDSTARVRKRPHRADDPDSCDPPHYYKHGVKLFKPHCL